MSTLPDARGRFGDRQAAVVGRDDAEPPAAATARAALAAAEQIAERGAGKGIVVLHLHALAGRDVDHRRLELLAPDALLVVTSR